MNTEKARFILQARRPNGTDDTTPPVREALVHALHSPELSAWLAGQEKFDQLVARALSQVPPPPELRALILAGVTLEKTRIVFWRRPVWLALAASLALAGGLTLTPYKKTSALQNTPGIAELHARALHESQGMHPDMVKASMVGALGRWLENPFQRLTVGLPLDFAGLSAVGCRTLTVGGREVLEICFMRDRLYHLYVARRSDFAPGQGEGDIPIIAAQGGYVVASWTRGDLVHVLATEGDAAALRSVL
jgi:anti-sigma factor RsiW